MIFDIFRSMRLHGIFDNNVAIGLWIIALACGLSKGYAQEFPADFELPKLEVTPGLSDIKTLEIGLFGLEEIDLSIDLRTKALRSRNLLNMCMGRPKIVKKFKSPVFEFTSKKEKSLRFTTENNQFRQSQNTYNRFLRGQGHPMPRAIYGNPRL